MSFSLPDFNLDVNIWDIGRTPPSAPDRTVKGNLAWARRVHTMTESDLIVNVAMTLLLPPGTNIQSYVQSAGSTGYVEVPAGTRRYYQVQGVDDIGKGFPNEHRCALIIQTALFGAWPKPMP